MTTSASEKIYIDSASCSGCGLCVLSCPVDVIRLDEASKKAMVVFPRDCQVCYLCEDDCPTHSISLSHDISNSRRFSTYDQFGIEI
jgi:NAD-dependent dihydropyrimidine dehydrogenase PreA subunit